MANFDILFFDIDGTLVGPDHFTISPRNREAVLAAKAAGVKLAFATGRCRCILPESALDLGFDYALTSNGAAIDDLHSGALLQHTDFDPALARVACPIVAANVDFYELFANGEILLTRACHDKIHTRPLPPWHKKYLCQGTSPVVESLEEYLAAGAPGLEKINIVESDNADIARIDAALRPLEVFELSSGMGNGYEIAPKGRTKGAGVRWLCGHLGIDLARCAALGDGGNDVEMLKAAGCGVAMGNGSGDVQSAADIVTDRYDRDGAAKFIEQYVL